MRAVNRLKLTLAVWTAAVLGLLGGGCEQVAPFAQTGMMVKRAAAPQPNDCPVVVSQTVYQPTDAPVIAPVPAPAAMMPSQLPLAAGPMPHGTTVTDTMHVPPGPAPLPHELLTTMHPPYIIEPPDTLIIDALRLIPRPPYRIEPLDILIVQVAETLPNQPITGPYAVQPDGTINLGYSYGMVRVAGLTLEQAVAAIRDQLKLRLREPQVSLALASMRAIQQIRGEHLVGQDGTITLGSYGCVNITGLQLWQAKLVIERYLSRWFLNPDISITVNGFNSKVYYVIFDGGGYGQQIARLPVTGNERVLDAIANVGGLPPVASRKKIWVARPSPKCCYQMLPVDWAAITMGGDPSTNWQLFPGDRVYVEADPLIAADNWLAKILAPIDRILGSVLLGATTYQTLQGNAFFP